MPFTLRPKPSIPIIFFLDLVNNVIFSIPRSIKIWAPTPYSFNIFSFGVFDLVEFLFFSYFFGLVIITNAPQIDLEIIEIASDNNHNKSIQNHTKKLLKTYFLSYLVYISRSWNPGKPPGFRDPYNYTNTDL